MNINTLTLTDNSSIDFGQDPNNSSVLTIDAIDWSNSSNIFSLMNYDFGEPTVNDQLIFDFMLSAAEKNQLLFVNPDGHPAGNYSASEIDLGDGRFEYIPDIVVPESSTIITAGLAVAVIAGDCLRRRRKHRSSD